MERSEICEWRSKCITRDAVVGCGSSHGWIASRNKQGSVGMDKEIPGLAIDA